MMDSEIYKKIGRGGAGNYYSKQDLDDATKRATDDVEAQQGAVPSHMNRTGQANADYANSGRGGAGNFVKRDGQSTAGSTVKSSTTASLRESAVPEMRYSGRGGAGNLRSGDVEKRRLENERRAKEARARAHEEVVKDVEMGLKLPERAHLGIGKAE